MLYITKGNSISVLNMSVRSTNCLHRAGIHSIGDMLNYAERHNWFNIKNMGIKSAAEVEKWVSVLQQGNNEVALVSEEEKALIASCNVKQTEMQSPANITCKEKSIDELQLSVRAKNALKNARILYISQLLGKSKEDLLAIRNLGENTAQEILDVIEKAVPEVQQQDAVAAYPSHVILDIAQSMKKAYEGSLSYYIGILCKVMREYPEVQGESLLYRTYENNDIRSALKEKILSLLEKREEGISLHSLSYYLPFHLSNTTIAEEVVLELEVEGAVSENEGELIRKYPTFLSIAQKIDDEKRRDIVLSRLSGQTLEMIAQRYSLTRERIRQILDRQICILTEKYHRFDEDYYRYVFQTYNLSYENFQHMFDLHDSYYYYLAMIDHQKQIEKKPLEQILNDDRVSVKIKKEAEKIIYRDYIISEGVRIKKERPSLVAHYIKRNCRKLTAYNDFFEGYNAWLKEVELYDKVELCLNSRYENHISSSMLTLWNQGRSFRYYPIRQYNFDLLLDTLNLTQYENTELSTLKLFRDYPELMEEYDLHDEYELHNLLRKIWPKDEHMVVFKRMPTIEIGKANQDEQVLNLLIQYAPVSAEDLAKHYEEAYGVKSQTVIATRFKAFDEYFYEGVYSIDADMMPQLHFSRMRKLLVQDYYTISSIIRIYKQEFPDASQSNINPFTLKLLGFRVYSRYVIKNNYSTSVEYFQHLLTCKEVVDARQFDKSILSLGNYAVALGKLRRNREIVEYAPHQYINLNRLSGSGVDLSYLEDYCDSVCNFVQPGEFFSIKSIRQDGFVHPLDETGFDDWFYGSVLLEDREHFSCCKANNVRIFKRDKSTITFLDFLYDLVDKNNKYDIHDLKDCLEERYGIIMERSEIIEFIKSTDMYYDAIMEAVYINYETYFEEV